jgi:hypothetical protein
MLEAWNLVPTLLASILQIRGEKKECVWWQLSSKGWRDRQ